MDQHRDTDLNIDQAHQVNVKELELERNVSTVEDVSKTGTTNETVERK
jgi:hypothetical protein